MKPSIVGTFENTLPNGGIYVHHHLQILFLWSDVLLIPVWFKKMSSQSFHSISIHFANLPQNLIVLLSLSYIESLRTLILVILYSSHCHVLQLLSGITYWVCSFCSNHFKTFVQIMSLRLHTRNICYRDFQSSVIPSSTLIQSSRMVRGVYQC